jgi:transposase
LVQGAQTVLLRKEKQSTGLSAWLNLIDLTSRKRKKVTTVAMANKMARMVWAVLSKDEAYRPPLLAETVAA